MTLIRSRNFWVLALCAGGVLAAATAGGLVFLGKDAPAHAPAQHVAVAKAEGGDGDDCSYPDQVIVEGAGGPSGAWSYFGTGVPVTVGGSISYLCQGKPAGGYTSQFWMAVTCDGAPLNVQYDDAPGETWSASFTSPTTQSVCSVQIRADTAGGASGESDETFVFLTDPGTAPTITMTNPQSGTIVHPDEITISAEANVSAPHVITKVQFFDASSLNPEGPGTLGTREQMPFELTGVTLKPASHLIYAIATDSRGYQARSQRAQLQVNSNQAPHVKVRSPIAGAMFATPATIAIIADVTDPDPTIGPPGGIKRISIYAGATLLDDVIWRHGPSSEHREFSWQNPPVGQHEIFVEAQDQRGAIRRIGPVLITVTADAAPTAKVTAPVDGLFQVPNSAITLSAAASDDRTISQIDFVVAPWPGTTGQVIVTGVAPVASALYRNTWTSTSSWTPTVAGRYVIRARVKDGAARPVVDSDAVEVYVDDNGSGNFVPSVRIVKPVNSDGVRLGASMPITVNVQDGTGETGIDAVDVFLDNATTPLWSLTRTPGANTWVAAGVLTVSMPEGAHTLLARARDGGVGSAFRGDSPRVAFTVLAPGANPAPVATIELPAGITSLGVNTATTLSVKARDINIDGTISTIEIFSNGAPISPAQVLSPVAGWVFYSDDWTPTAAGDYDLFARVKDNANLISDSPLLKIRVTAVAGNTPPNIAFNLPENGSDFEVMPGGSVTLRVAVNDPAAAAGGTPGISAVDFFDGSTRIGTVNSGFPSGTGQTTATFNWLNPSEGSHGLTARARDSQGSVTFASPINVFILGGPPTVSIVSPVAGQAGYIAPEDIWTMVDVQDDSGRISKVEYFLDGVHKGESAVAPFDFHFQNVGAGAHALTARAWDFGLHSTLSAPVNITVAPNQLPIISITAPTVTTPRAEFGEGSEIALSAAVLDPDDHDIEMVEYLRSGSVIYTTNHPPFNGTWHNVAAGLNTQLTARATDIRGGVGYTTSATAVDVIAAQAPNVALTAPAATEYFVGDTITLAADASDPDQRFGGRILSVQFFRRPSGNPNPGTAIGAPITTAPYRLDWQPTVTGNLDVYAVAVDSGPAGRNTRESVARAVTIRINTAPTSVTLKIPKMPSHYLNTPLSHTLVAPNGILRLKATVVDAEQNVERMEFRLQKVGSPESVLVKTVTRTTLGQTEFTGDAQLDPAVWGAVDEIVYVHAKAIDSRNAFKETDLELSQGDDPPFTSCGGDFFGECVNISTPIAIVDPTRVTSPCNVANESGPCQPGRYLIEPGQVTRIEAERYDQGGHGVGFFERDRFAYADVWNPENARQDEVDIQNCDSNLGASCVVGKVDDGETMRYSVTMVNAVNGGGVVRKLRIWLPPPVTRIASLCDQSTVSSESEVTLEAAVVSGLVPGSTEVEFYVDDSPLGTSIPEMTDGFSQSTRAHIGWEAVPAGTYQLKARTKVQRVAGTYVVGEFSDPITVTRTKDQDFVSVECPQTEGRAIALESAFGSADMIRSSGEHVNVACPGTITELDPQFPNDNWYFVTHCAIPLPQGDYWLNYYSPQDGVKLDWFDLSIVDMNPTGPTAEVLSPASNALFAVNTQVTLTSNVIGAINGQAKVDYYIRRAGQTTPVIVSTLNNATAPYAATHNFNEIGDYTISAKATVNNVTSLLESARVSFKILNNIGNAPPQVTLAQPATNPTQVSSGALFELQATATDPDGLINSVSFNVNDGQGARQAVLSGGLYRINWQAPTVTQQTNYTVTVTAVDNGTPIASTTSPLRTIQVMPIVTGPVHPHDIAAAIPTSISAYSDGVGATAGQFRVDESGAATYSIALLAAPGRAGVQPQISLNYSSQAGTGPMGKGWSIGGVSGISRCREAFELGDASATTIVDGEEISAGSRPVDFSINDRFCLDGQRLVLISGAYGVHGSEYRTEMDQFARIRLFDVDAIPGPNYFVVQRKDGSTAWYGDRISFTGLAFGVGATESLRPEAYLDRNHNIGSGALIVPPPGTEPAISWAMTRTMDSSGNYIDYRYSKNAAIGEQLLSEVQFTGRTKLATQVTPDQQTFASIRFDYSVLPDSEKGVSYQSGMRSQLTRRLSKVVSLSGSQVLRTYDLSYVPIWDNAGVSGLTQITECTPTNPNDPNGAQVCYRPTTFEWSQAKFGMPSDYMRDGYNFKYHKSSKLGDIDGDGRMDLVVVEANSPRQSDQRLCPEPTQTAEVVRVFYSTTIAPPVGHSSSRELDFSYTHNTAAACIDQAEGTRTAASWMLFDFNGDGRDDLMVADRSDDTFDIASGVANIGANNRWDRWHIYPSLGHPVSGRAFNQSPGADLLPDCTGFGVGDHCVPVSPLGGLAQLADVNGDGLPDVLYAKHRGDVGLDAFRVRLLERVMANPNTGETKLQYSTEMQVGIDWNSWGNLDFPCHLPDGYNLSHPQGDPSVQGMHFSHCRVGVEPTVAEFNGDGSADLLASVSHVALNMAPPQPGFPCIVPQRAPATGRSVVERDVYWQRGAEDDALWQAHNDQIALNLPSTAFCHIATHTTSFHYQLVADRIEPPSAGAPGGRLVFKEYGRNLASIKHVPGTTENGNFLLHPLIADFNGDGLTDLLFQNLALPVDNTRITQYLNLGTRMQTVGEASSYWVNDESGDYSTDLYAREFMEVFDVNGDGRDDVVYPEKDRSDSGDNYFLERRTHKDGRLGSSGRRTSVLGHIQAGQPPNWLRFFNDFDGDGSTDYVAWQIWTDHGGGAGEEGGSEDNLVTSSAQDCSSTQTCADGSGSRHRARQVISAIRNGYGTETRIKYDPLTNAAVYQRAQNSRNLVNSGRGTAVQDLGGPIYVVSRVDSDTPTADNPAATAKLYYQYADARIQGGGRGNLGFAEIRTIDPNLNAEHVVTISQYSQVYPFTGLPRETRKYRVGGNYAAPACIESSLETGSNCFQSQAAVNPFFAEPSGTLLSYGRNLYAVNENYPGVVHPYLAATFQATGNPDAGGIQTMATNINYAEFDGYGNAVSNDSYIAKGTSYGSLAALRTAANAIYNESTSVRGNACATGCVKHTRTEELTYADDTVNWRIGRLTASTVRHTRYSAAGTALPTKTRRTAFTYYMDGARTGLLKMQTLQPGRGGSEEMRSINFYDDYGNSIGSMQCSSDVSANDCDDPSDFGKVLQRTKGANDAPLYRVHRYSRSTMSVGINSIDGRYAVGGFAPFFNDSASSANQVLELSTGQVLASDRDALGNVKYATDAHGVWASATFGPMGRGQTSATQSGGKSASEFHWCAPMPNNNGPVAACPSGAVFRQTSYTLGGARSITFFDKLGRAYFAVTEGFNADVVGSASNSHWSGACTGYDTRGRVVRATNPFYVNVNDAASPPTLLENTSCVAGAHAETRTAYDYLDRVTEILMPEHTPSEPAITLNVFDGLRTTTRVSVYRDGDGNGSEEAVELIKEEWTDASGMKVSVRDQDTLITNYAYDSVDQLTALTRQASAGSNVITSSMVYDDLGRKTEQSDPDAGIVRYAYNAAGEMICSEDARGMATVTDYDALGRAWRVSSGRPAGSCALPAPAAQTVSATDVPTVGTGASRSIDLTLFDTIQRGLVSKVTRVQTTGDSGAGYGSVDTYVQTFAYDDPLARLTSTVTTISPVAGGTAELPYVQSLTYDGLGRVAITTDATGGRVENMYSSHGFLRRVRDAAAPATVYWELLASNERGQATRERRHGDARISTRRDYDALTGRLQAILSGFDNGSTFVNPVQNLSYQYDMLGNLRSRTDLSLNLRERFVYDKLDRLVTGYATGINGNAAAFNTADLSYDRIGNICAKDGLGYTYAGAAGCGLDLLLGAAQNLVGRSPHAATRRALASGQFVEYGYDLAGNQILADDPNGVVKDRRIRFNADGLADRIAVGDISAPSSVSSFRYAAGGRYLRIDKVGSVETVTRYVGGVEWITKTNAVEERKRYIGGFLILTETGAPSALSKTYRYILGDHLGSLDTLVDQYGDVIEKLSFDPHGNRRAASSNGVWDNLLGSYIPSNTTHGFTGHEHVDLSNIIHMNGRLYDPVLGRMLSADPIIQAPFNAQNLNRYTYVLNNPLSLTDPTGLSWLNDNWRMVAAVAITVVTGGQGFWIAVAGGAASGAVATASTEGAVQGAFTAAVFYGIGTYFQAAAEANVTYNAYQASLAATEGMIVASSRQLTLLASGLTAGQTAAKVLSHAVAGGVMAEMGGGKFGNGFLSAGVTQALSGKIDAIQGAPARIVAAALIGGTVSAATGGKFANGALTAAFSRAFNDEQLRHKYAHDIHDVGPLGPRETSNFMCRPVDKTKFMIGLGRFESRLRLIADEEGIKTYNRASIYVKTKGAEELWDRGAETVYERQSILFEYSTAQSIGATEFAMTHEFRHLMKENNDTVRSGAVAAVLGQNAPHEIDAQTWTTRFLNGEWVRKQ